MVSQKNNFEMKNGIQEVFIRVLKIKSVKEVITKALAIHMGSLGTGKSLQNFLHVDERELSLNTTPFHQSLAADCPQPQPNRGYDLRQGSSPS